jgi:hypothetical protein
VGVGVARVGCSKEWRISWASKLQLTLGSMCACTTVLQGVLCGMMSGAFGQFFASPTDLIKVASAPLGACCHSVVLFPVAVVLPTPDAVCVFGCDVCRYSRSPLSSGATAVGWQADCCGEAASIQRHHRRLPHRRA